MEQVNPRFRIDFRVIFSHHSGVSIFLIFALVFYTTNQLHFPISTGVKGVNIFNILFLMILFINIQRNSDKQLYSTPLKSRFLFFFLVSFIALFISILNGSGTVVSDITYLKTIIFYMSIYFLIFHFTENMETIKYLTVVILIVAMIAALEGVREAVDYGIGDYVESHRVAGPFGEDFYSANRAGVYYSMFVPVFLTFILYLKTSRMTKFLLIGGLFLTITAVLFTYSRQSYFISIVVVALIFMRRRFSLTILLVLALLLYEVWVPASVIQRIEGTEQVNVETGEAKLDESTDSRFIIWRHAWTLISNEPFGVGINQFQPRIAPHLGHPKDAHNNYVLVTTEMGFQGLLAYLILLLGFLRLGLRNATQSETNFEESTGYAFFYMTIAMAFGNIYGSPFFNGEVMTCYWVFAGLNGRIFYLQQLRNKNKYEHTQIP